MTSRNLLALFFLGLGGLAAAPGVQAADQDGREPPVVARIQAALAHERRPEADRARDANRRPLETLRFLGLTHDMTVLELIPGGGWYTRILGPTLAGKGKLYLALFTNRAERLIADDPEGFKSTQILPLDSVSPARAEGERRFTLPQFSFGLRGIDLALTFRNMHNFTEQGRKRINSAVFRALKRGGHYGVVDHTRRHMAADSEELWRRMDPVQIIKEVQEAGFELVDYSRLHYRADDELAYEVGRRSVTGNTDRFTLLFRKP